VNRAGQRGITLPELLVALAIMLIAVAGALTLYDATWKSFRQGENAAEQQQGLRIAFEKIGLDLQMAGFNFNPDGHSSRPDEQLEAAYDTAIVVRGDFDGELEASLAGDAFEVVSTGNDEVVAYVLAKSDRSSTGSLSFEADLEEVPRDGEVELVTVPNVALVHDDPPYTLYRVRFGAWGGSDFVEREILADNIGSMTFRYYDAAGSQINSTFNLTTTADDIGGAESAASDRSRIARIEVDLLGLARHPRRDWVDVGDPDPKTKRYRKFRLASNIRPRNLGLVVVPDDGSLPPG
jgi:prepilin-type N-terminal cleavage/methylation domain-containing protein